MKKENVKHMEEIFVGFGEHLNVINKLEVNEMAKLCPIEGCKANPGMCKHDWMMLIVLIIIIVVVLYYAL